MPIRILNEIRIEKVFLYWLFENDNVTAVANHFSDVFLQLFLQVFKQKLTVLSVL